VFVAIALKNKVKITFCDGAHLAGPDNLFNNGLEGKRCRAFDIYKDHKINERSLKTLVVAAVYYNHARLKPANKPGRIRVSPKQKQI
jgi:hypothetical protein